MFSPPHIAFRSPVPMFVEAEKPSAEAELCWLMYMLDDLATGNLSEKEFTALLDETSPAASFRDIRAALPASRICRPGYL